MIDISIDNMLKKTKNKFMLVNATSARAKQIIEGSLPYIEDFDPNNPIITALREIASDKIIIRVGTPEVEKKKKAEAKEEKPVKEKGSVLDRLAKDTKKKVKTSAKTKKSAKGGSASGGKK